MLISYAFQYLFLSDFRVSKILLAEAVQIDLELSKIVFLSFCVFNSGDGSKKCRKIPNIRPGRMEVCKHFWWA